MLFRVERISDGEEFALGQCGEKEAQDLQKNLSRQLALLHQLRCKFQILKILKEHSEVSYSTSEHLTELNFYCRLKYGHQVRTR